MGGGVQEDRVDFQEDGEMSRNMVWECPGKQGGYPGKWGECPGIWVGMSRKTGWMFMKIGGGCPGRRVDVQADLRFHWVHMPLRWFCYVAAHT